jgi:hypothetical protein
MSSWPGGDGGRPAACHSDFFVSFCAKLLFLVNHVRRMERIPLHSLPPERKDKIPFHFKLDVFQYNFFLILELLNLMKLCKVENHLLCDQKLSSPLQTFKEKDVFYRIY